MKLTKQEAVWLAAKCDDFFYYIDVESMFEKDQHIYQDIGQKLSEVKQ